MKPSSSSTALAKGRTKPRSGERMLNGSAIRSSPTSNSGEPPKSAVEQIGPRAQGPLPAEQRLWRPRRKPTVPPA